MSKKIMTVMGPIAPNELGFTSMHEHILFDFSYYGELARKKFPPPDKIRFPCERDDPIKIENLAFLRNGYYSYIKDNTVNHDEDLMIAEINDFKFAGGSAILENTVPGARGDVEGLRRISKATGVHIIASTGLYAEESWPKKFLDMSVDDFVEYMKNEIEHGIDGTDVKPGHLKFAPNSLSPREEKMLRAIARVSMETGYPATIHHGILLNKEQGRKMVKILVEEGVQPERIVLAHMDKLSYNYDSYQLKNYLLDPNSRRLELDYAKEVLDLGFNISFDTFGHNWNLETRGWVNQTDYERLAGLIALIKEGYSKQLVIGCDIYEKCLTRRKGGDGFARLLNFVVPTLREIDIHEDDIQNITFENPARILSV